MNRPTTCILPILFLWTHIWIVSAACPDTSIIELQKLITQLQKMSNQVQDNENTYKQIIIDKKNQKNEETVKILNLCLMRLLISNKLTFTKNQCQTLNQFVDDHENIHTNIYAVSAQNKEDLIHHMHFLKYQIRDYTKNIKILDNARTDLMHKSIKITQELEDIEKQYKDMQILQNSICKDIEELKKLIPKQEQLIQKSNNTH